MFLYLLLISFLILFHIVESFDSIVYVDPNEKYVIVPYTIDSTIYTLDIYFYNSNSSFLTFDCKTRIINSADNFVSMQIVFTNCKSKFVFQNNNKNFAKIRVSFNEK